MQVKFNQIQVLCINQFYLVFLNQIVLLKYRFLDLCIQTTLIEGKTFKQRKHVQEIQT